MKASPATRFALSGLIITGRAVSDVKVNCNVPVVTKLPSVTVNVVFVLPSATGVPEMSPDTGSALSPQGQSAASWAEEEPFAIITWNWNGCAVLPVTLVPLMITGPDGGVS